MVEGLRDRGRVLLRGGGDVPQGAVRSLHDPPTPHSDFETGLTTVAPAVTAASNRARTFPGCEATRESVYPRKPEVPASASRKRSRSLRPKAVS
ncbi:hypothetical protein MHM582_0738 [Microbacterium sp. HM58-2]|nr:hypothetical protein MHM582_0738 [Microbacterium sp. HM58-2]